VTDTVLQEAYDNAAAVFSRSFRFVEWKFISINKKVAYPFGDYKEPIAKATTPIDREKWIYAFRHDPGSTGYAELAEEIRVSADGTLAATPGDKLDKPIESRGRPTAIGKTMCLPRRVMGTRVVYRLFASRVRLPVDVLKELKLKVHRLVPETVLEPGKNTSIIERDGEWFVPVVDPITVMLHLHAAYLAAADDVLNYTMPHKALTSAQRAVVTRRHKKHLLATLLKAIIGDEKNTGANNLVHELKDMQYGVEEYLAHHQEAVAWRVRRRIKLGGDLARWLESDAVRLQADAYRAAPKSAFGQFLLPWCASITRLPESPPGREYLQRLLNDKGHFVHKYVIPETDVSDDVFQFVRKSGLTILEAWKTLTEVEVLFNEGDVVNRTLDRLRRLTRERVNIKTSRLTVASIARAKSISQEIKAEITRIGDLTLGDIGHEGPQFGGAAKNVAFVIESVNLIFAVKAVQVAMEGTDEEARELAILGLVGSSIDAGSALASLFKNTDRLIAVMGFVSGIIDIYLGHIAMDKAFKNGDEDVASASFLTAAGATMGVASVCMGMMAIPGGQIVGMLGLAVVAIGSIMRAMFTKTDLEIFFAHCSWGKQYKKPGGADWSATRFENWHGEKEFDYQLDALLNILCKIEIDRGDSMHTLRELSFTMAWIPPGAKLSVRYTESWANPQDTRVLTADVTFTQAGPDSSNPKFPATAISKKAVKLRDVDGIAVGSVELKPPATHGGPRPYFVQSSMMTWMPNPELKQLKAEAVLAVELDGGHKFTIPHAGFQTKIYFDA
jgi:hypothetical protein